MNSLKLLFLYFAIFNSFEENAGKSGVKNLETIFLNPEENTVVSPFSIYSTLLPLELGSDGDTKIELQKLLQNFTISTLPPEISSSTALLISKDVKLIEEYSKSLTQFDVQTIANFNFSNYEYINEFIRNSTRGKITEIINESSFRKDTQMALVNGMYFEGIWNIPFQKTLRKRDFTLGSGQVILVEMMYQKMHAFYGKLPELDARIIDLPYKSLRQVLRIYLPYTPNGLPKLLEKISLADTFGYKPSLKFGEIEVYLPPLIIESSVRVTSGLDQIGIHTLTKSNSNLSKISNSTNFRLDEILCKTKIEIDTSGTKGGSATAAFIIPLSGFVTDDEFAVDKPFYFEIRDTENSIIYFSGVLAKPKPAESLAPLTDSEQTIPNTTEELPEYKIRLGFGDSKKNKIPIGNEDKTQNEGEITKDNKNDEETTEIEKWWIHTGRPEYLNMKNPTGFDELGENGSGDGNYEPRFQQPEPRSSSGIRFPYPLKDPNTQQIIDMHLRNMSLNTVV